MVPAVGQSQTRPAWVGALGRVRHIVQGFNRGNVVDRLGKSTCCRAVGKEEGLSLLVSGDVG